MVNVKTKVMLNDILENLLKFRILNRDIWNDHVLNLVLSIYV